MKLKKEWVTPAIVGVASFATGVGAGYLFSMYRIKKVLDKAEEDVTEMEFKYHEAIRQFNHAIQQSAYILNNLKERGEKLLEEAGEDEEPSILLSRARHPAFIEPEEEIEQEAAEATVSNIFPDDDPDWDYEEELAQRTDTEPYVIHRDEFFNEETDYTQSTITYYAGDNILCDEHDQPVYNHEKVVGDMLFGHGSNDPNVVYIRNDRLQAEWEVVLDRGHYMVEVLGQHIDDALAAKDIKHSKGVQKFRPD